MPTCEKCGSQKIQQNNEFVCIFCHGKKQVVPKRPPVMVEDPGEKELALMSGKAMQSQTKPYVKGTAQMVVTGSSVHDALAIMKSLPMPKDIKEFKKIQKIVKLMEALTGDDNGAD